MHVILFLDADCLPPDSASHIKESGLSMDAELNGGGRNKQAVALVKFQIACVIFITDGTASSHAQQNPETDFIRLILDDLASFY